MRSLKGREVIRILQKAGFQVVRSKGSHHIMLRDGHPGTVAVPVHAGRDIKIGTLNGIIRRAGLTADRFWQLDAE